MLEGLSERPKKIAIFILCKRSIPTQMKRSEEVRGVVTFSFLMNQLILKAFIFSLTPPASLSSSIENFSNIGMAETFLLI